MMSKPPPPRPPIRSGLVGIERKIQKDNVVTDKKISEAFQDINSLMQTAKPMVELIHKISDIMKEMQGDEVPEDEIKDFRQHLLSLGVKVKDPVTKSKHGKNEYFRKLAKEIADTLSDEIEYRAGVMTLVEAFVRLNRARGVSLVSPEDMFNACHYLEKEKLPIRLKEYGHIRVLQHINFDEQIYKETVVALIEVHEWLSVEKYAEIARMPPLVARHLFQLLEKEGLICRDDSIQGLRFYNSRHLHFHRRRHHHHHQQQEETEEEQQQ